MTEINRILLLAGSAESHAIAAGLARARRPVLASLRAAPRWEAPLPLPTRLGGFGGDDGFAAFLARERIAAVIDATHPFAARVSARTRAVCDALAVPLLQVLRDPWRTEGSETWDEVEDISAAAALVPPGARVFATTGREGLAGYRALRGGHLFLRRKSRDPLGHGLPNLTEVPGQGPFSVADEIATFRDLGIDTLIAKNSGSVASRTKVTAACALGLQVVLLRRPVPAGAPCVATARAALDWVAGLETGLEAGQETGQETGPEMGR